MRIVDLLVENLTHHTQDIDSCHHDGTAGDDGASAMEGIGIGKRTHEDGHLCDEAREARQSEVSQTSDDISYSEEGHDFHQTTHIADVTGVCTTIDHTDEGKEEGRHQTMRKHLQDGTRARGLGHHQQGEEHQAAVGNRRVGIDVLQVGLHAGAQCTIHHRDGGQDEENPSKLLSSLRQQIHGYAEATIASQLHQHTSVEHRHGGRRRSMTVGAPCVEREQSTQHTKSDEDEREEHLLDSYGDVVQSGNLVDIHRGGTTEEVDAQNTDDQQGRASHEHERQLHGSILFGTTSPHANQEVHGNQSHLVEHEHGEHVDRDEETIDTRREQGEPEEILFGHRLQLPRGEGAREDDDARQEQHHHRDAIHTYRVFDIQGLEPVNGVGIEHHVSDTSRTLLDEVYRQPDGQAQQTGGAYHHHTTHLTQVASQPEAKQHQDGDYYEYC